MVAGIMIGRVAPSLVESIVASVNRDVAVLIWAMLYPMTIGVDPASLRPVVKPPKGLGGRYLLEIAHQRIGPDPHLDPFPHRQVLDDHPARSMVPASTTNSGPSASCNNRLSACQRSRGASS